MIAENVTKNVSLFLCLLGLSSFAHAASTASAMVSNSAKEESQECKFEVAFGSKVVSEHVKKSLITIVVPMDAGSFNIISTESFKQVAEGKNEFVILVVDDAKTATRKFYEAYSFVSFLLNNPRARNKSVLLLPDDRPLINSNLIYCIKYQKREREVPLLTYLCSWEDILMSSRDETPGHAEKRKRLLAADDGFLRNQLGGEQQWEQIEQDVLGGAVTRKGAAPMRGEAPVGREAYDASRNQRLQLINMLTNIQVRLAHLEVLLQQHRDNLDGIEALLQKRRTVYAELENMMEYQRRGQRDEALSFLGSADRILSQLEGELNLRISQIPSHWEKVGKWCFLIGTPLLISFAHGVVNNVIFRELFAAGKYRSLAERWDCGHAPRYEHITGLIAFLFHLFSYKKLRDNWWGATRVRDDVAWMQKYAFIGALEALASSWYMLIGGFMQERGEVCWIPGYEGKRGAWMGKGEVRENVFLTVGLGAMKLAVALMQIGRIGH